MPTIDPRRALRYGFYVLGGCFLLALVLRLGAFSPPDDSARDILAVDLARRMHANALALDSARHALAARRTQVTQTVTRYQTVRDSLVITDTVQVKVFVQAADSMKRSCMAYVESCDRFRVRADSSLASLTTDRDFWRDRFEHAKPSKWAPVREWAIRGLIGYGAFKLGQAAR